MSDINRLKQAGQDIERSSFGSPGARQLRARVADSVVAAVRSRIAGPPQHSVIRVLIADDHVLFRRGLEMVLQGEPEIEVVGEAGDALAALRRAEELRPDVVLLDVAMPKRGGIDACRAITKALPSTRIIMLTASDHAADLFSALRAGAHGYLLKDIPGEEIAAGIRAVHTGQRIITPSIASMLLAEFPSLDKNQAGAPDTSAPKLTHREVEVLHLLARGWGTVDIGQQLFISEGTVKNHVRNTLEKYQLQTRLQDAAATGAINGSTSSRPDEPGDPVGARPRR